MADPHSRVNLDTLAVADSEPETLQCCCGNTDCVYLKHNCSVLDSVEKDVHTAAKLGQVRRMQSSSPQSRAATTFTFSARPIIVSNVVHVWSPSLVLISEAHGRHSPLRGTCK